MKAVNLEPDLSFFYAIESDLNDGEFEEVSDSVFLPLYWNNEEGWVSIVEATNFSEEEVLEFELPELSHWVKVEVIANWIASLDVHFVHTTLAVDRNVQIYPKQMITDPGSEGKTHLRIV